VYLSFFQQSSPHARRTVHPDLHIFEQQPSGGLEGLLLADRLRLVIQPTPEVREAPVIELEDVKMVKHNRRLGQMRHNGTDGAWGHVHLQLGLSPWSL